MYQYVTIKLDEFQIPNYLLLQYILQYTLFQGSFNPTKKTKTEQSNLTIYPPYGLLQDLYILPYVLQLQV